MHVSNVIIKLSVNLSVVFLSDFAFETSKVIQFIAPDRCNGTYDFDFEMLNHRNYKDMVY